MSVLQDQYRLDASQALTALMSVETAMQRIATQHDIELRIIGVSGLLSDAARIKAALNGLSGGAISAAKATEVGRAVAHLNSTYGAGRITLKEYTAQLAVLNQTATADIVAIEREISALRRLNVLQDSEAKRLAELVVQQKSYADSLIAVAAAETRAAQAARERSLSTGLLRAAGGTGMNNAAMVASFISPEAGMLGMAASMGPTMAAAASVGLAVKGVVDLTIKGQEEAKKWQQAFLVMSANGVKNLDEVAASINNIAVNGTEAEKMFSKAALAQAMAELARGGVKGAEALKTIAVSAELAAAEHVPLNHATELLYANLQHLDMGGDQAASFGDKLARASHMSLASMDKLSLGMNVVGQTAHTMGFSVEETLAMLVQLAKKGMDPATIGATGLRNAMQMAIKPSEKAKQIYAELGIALKDSEGHARSGHDIMMDLQKVMTATGPIYNQLTGKIMNQNDLAAASFEIFGTRSATAFLGLRGKLHDLTEEINDSQGFLNHYSGEVVSGLEGAQKRLDAATKNLSLTFAKTFTPLLTTAAKGLTDIIRAIDPMAQKLNDVTQNGKLAAWLREVSVALMGVGVAMLYVKRNQIGGLWASALPTNLPATLNLIKTGLLGAATAARTFAAANPWLIWITGATLAATAIQHVFDEIHRAQDETAKNDVKTFNGYMGRVNKLTAAGDPLSMQKARYLLAVESLQEAQRGTVVGKDIGGNAIYKADPAEVKKAQDNLVAQQAKLVEVAAATKVATAAHKEFAAQAGGPQVKLATQAQIDAYKELGAKLDDLKGKFAESKTTEFQKGLVDARHAVADLDKQIDQLLKKGKITPDQAKGRKADAAAALDQITANLVIRQLETDKKTIQDHQREIEDARLSLIQDGAAKRRAEYDREVADLGSKYGPQIKEALQNAQAKGLTTAQRRELQGTAGQLQQEEAEAKRAAAAKLQRDLDQIDEERVKKVRDSAMQTMQAYTSEMEGRSTVFEAGYKRAQDAAGDDVAKRLQIEQTYAPRLAQMQAAAREAKFVADQQALQNQLQDDLKAADNQGRQTAQLKQEATQRYLTNSRALEAAYASDIQGYQIAAQQAVSKARADVTKKALETEMQGIKQWTGAQLASYQAVLQAKLKVAQAEGDGDRVKVLSEALKTVADQQFTNITEFKKNLGDAVTGVSELRQQLADLNPTKDPLKAAQVSATKPFDDIIQEAKKKQAALADAFQLLTPEQQAQQIGRYQGLMRDYTRIAVDSGKQRQVAYAKATGDELARQAEERYASQRKELNNNLELAHTDAERNRIRSELLALDQARLAVLPAEIAAAKRRGDSEEQINKLKEEQSGLNKSIAQAELDGIARDDQRHDSALKLLQAQHAYAAAVAQTNADVVAAKQQAIQDTQAEADQIARVIAEAQQRGLTEAQIDDKKAELVQKQTSLYEQQKALREYLYQLDRDSLALLESQIKLQATASGSINDPIAAKQMELEAGRRQIAELTREMQTQSQEERTKTQTTINGLLADEINKQRELVQLDFTRRQSAVDLANARASTNAKLSGMGDDAVTMAELDLKRQKDALAAAKEAVQLAIERGAGEAEINSLLKTQEEAQGNVYDSEKKLAEATRSRLDLMVALELAQDKLNRVIAAVGDPAASFDEVNRRIDTTLNKLRELGDKPGGADWTLQNDVLSQELQDLEKNQAAIREAEAMGITRVLLPALDAERDAREATARAALEVGRAQAEYNQASSTDNAQKLKTATESLTSAIQAQRAAIKATADAYLNQISQMDAVRSATDSLKKTVYGDQDAKFDSNRETDRFFAIEKRRQQAIKEAQDALASGDQERMAKSLQTLDTVEKRAREQQALLGKNGLSVQLGGEEAVAGIVNAADRLGIQYDKQAADLAARADIASRESEAISQFGQFVATFQAAVSNLKGQQPTPTPVTSTAAQNAPVKLALAPLPAVTPAQIQEAVTAGMVAAAAPKYQLGKLAGQGNTQSVTNNSVVYNITNEVNVTSARGESDDALANRIIGKLKDMQRRDGKNCPPFTR